MRKKLRNEEESAVVFEKVGKRSTDASQTEKLIRYLSKAKGSRGLPESEEVLVPP